jgi:chorismate dehydratase
MSQASPRCGRISYTNDLPIYAAFDAGALTFPGSLVADVPTELNRALLDGRLDVSPISSFFYGQHTDALTLLPAVCIGAPARVLSICCISSRPLAMLRHTPMAITPQSATGKALVQTICRTWYGFDPPMIERADPFAAYTDEDMPCLVIGDAALDAAEAAPAGSIYDIGALWHELTGQAMVYAVWAVRNDYAARQPFEVGNVARILKESLDWGRAHIDDVIKTAQRVRPRAADFYSHYYRALDFDFGESAGKALAFFFRRAREAGVLANQAPLEFFYETPQHA